MADCLGEEGNGGFGMSDKLIIRPSDSPFFIKMGGGGILIILWKKGPININKGFLNKK
jgi:hypothetical protein